MSRPNRWFEAGGVGADAPAPDNLDKMDSEAAVVPAAPQIVQINQIDHAPAQIAEAAPGRFDDGIPIEWRDGLASLIAMRCPGAFKPADWRAIVQGAALMVRNHGLELARRNWTARDLFAVDASEPWRRTDGAGVARFLIGREVEAVRDGALVLRVNTQTVQVFPRPRLRVGLVLLWELAQGRAVDE